MRERRHLDRTQHERVIDNRRRRQRNPDPDTVDRAKHAVGSHDVPGTPNVQALKVLDHVPREVHETDTREVRNYSIRAGKPRHGAKRSDDHIGRYVIALPLAEVDDEVLVDPRCPDCGCDRGVYDYQAYHYISANEAIICDHCEAVLHGESWE